MPPKGVGGKAIELYLPPRGWAKGGDLVCGVWLSLGESFSMKLTSPIPNTTTPHRIYLRTRQHKGGEGGKIKAGLRPWASRAALSPNGHRGQNLICLHYDKQVCRSSKQGRFKALGINECSRTHSFIACATPPASACFTQQRWRARSTMGRKGWSLCPRP